MDDENENVSTLKCMGFNEALARQALSMCNGNVDLAVDRLISGMVPPISNTNASNINTNTNTNDTNTVIIESPAYMIQAPISQYSLPSGKSACTCIALETSSSLLQYLNNTNQTGDQTAPSATDNTTANANATKIRQFLTADRLMSITLAGGDLYNSLKQSSGRGYSHSHSHSSPDENADVQHLSPEEVLSFLQNNPNSNSFKSGNIRLMDGGVRQGILTAGDGPLGLKSLIQGCQSDQKQGQWICVVMTKTPETVCIMLPPLSSPISIENGNGNGNDGRIINDGSNRELQHRHQQQQQQQHQPFVLIDSHPRLSFGADGSYALFHDSLEGLVNSLERIFPATHLDSADVGELMAAMYNSFDMYPLTNG